MNSLRPTRPTDVVQDFQHRGSRRGFTLLEVLMVAALIAILAAMILPVVQRSKGRSRQVECLSRIRQVGLAYQMFAHDHNSRFPFQTPVRDGGTLEMVQSAPGLGHNVQYAFRHFQALSNDLPNLTVLICPADERTNATSFPALRNENLSFFAAVTAQPGRSDSILGGDRNLAGSTGAGSVGGGAVLRFGPDAMLAWTKAGHQYRGNLLHADGHVEMHSSGALQNAFRSSPGPVSVWLPVGGPTTLSPAGAGSSSGPAAGSGTPGAGGASGPGSVSGQPGGLVAVQNVFNAPPDVEGGADLGSPRREATIANSAASAGPIPAPVARPAARRDPPPAAQGKKPPVATNAANGRPATNSPTAPPPVESPVAAAVTPVQPSPCWWCWLVLLAVGMAVSFLVGMRMQRRRPPAAN